MCNDNRCKKLKDQDGIDKNKKNHYKAKGQSVPPRSNAGGGNTNINDNSINGNTHVDKSVQSIVVVLGVMMSSTW